MTWRAKNAKVMKQLSEARDKFPAYFIAIHLYDEFVSSLEGATYNVQSIK